MPAYRSHFDFRLLKAFLFQSHSKVNDWKRNSVVTLKLHLQWSEQQFSKVTTEHTKPHVHYINELPLSMFPRVFNSFNDHYRPITVSLNIRLPQCIFFYLDRCKIINFYSDYIWIFPCFFFFLNSRDEKNATTASNEICWNIVLR